MILVTSSGDLLQADSDTPTQFTSTGRESLAVNSVPFGIYGQQGLTMLDGRPVSFAELYRKQVWVGVMVNKLARQISRLPLKVYERDSQGDRKRVREHSLVDLIRTPAPGCNAGQLKQWLATPTLIHGNGVLSKIRTNSARAPHRLWPLDWRYMEVFARGGTDAIADPFVFWRSREFGGALDIDPRDIVHVRWHAVDSKIGISPLEQLGVTVRIEGAAQDYQQNYLEHGVRPPSAVQLPQGVVIDKDTRAEMRADLNAAYGGAANAGNPVLLPGGVEWKSIAHSAHDAELIQQRHLTREEVAAAYDVPPPMVGILDKASFSNITEQHKMLFTTVLGPWLTMIEETFQAQIIDPEPEFGGLFVEFDLAEVLKGDKVKEMAALKTAVQSGLYTINEARQILNLPSFDEDWCDQPLIPVNNLGSSPEPPTGTTDALAERLAEAVERAAHSSRNGN